MSNYSEGAKIPQAMAPDARHSQGGSPFLSGAWPLAFLLLLALLPYAGILHNDFAYIYDDKAQILDNPYVHTFGHLREALTTPVWSFADAHGTTNYYRPVMTLGFLLCYQIFGPLAFGFHLASLLLHAAVVLTLYLFAERLLRHRGAALAAAGLFALHPVHVESVAWISAVTDLELTFFYLLTFWCFLQVDQPTFYGRLRMQGCMAICFLLALLSKEQALTLAVLAVIYEHFYRADRNETTWAQKIGRYGVLWMLLLGYVLMRVRLMGSFAHAMGWVHLTLFETFLSALALLGQYIFKLIWPAYLSAFYVFHASTHLTSAPVLKGLGALAICVAVFGVLWKKARPASFGILWLLCTLAPVLNARLMGSYVLADRYLYLPTVGFCLVAGWAIAGLWQAASKRQAVWRWPVAFSGCIIVALCVFRIVTRIPDWQDDVTLISRALAAEPDEFVLHDALGDAYWMRGEEALAEHEWKETLRLKPDFVRPIDALGALYAKEGRYDEAKPYLERAIQLSTRDADSHLNLGAVYAETHQMDRAEEQFRIAISIAPLNFAAHNVLGKLYLDSGRLKEAEDQFRQSLQVEPNLAAYDHLGYIYAQMGDQGRAEEAFKASLAMNGADSHAHYHLGLIYAATGRKAQAVVELQAALAIDPNNAEIRSALNGLRH